MSHCSLIFLMVNEFIRCEVIVRCFLMVNEFRCEIIVR